jgi:hypothetical protein
MSWDVAEQQVFICFEDPGFSWHHRILILPGGAPGVWLACSSDYLVEILNLADYAVVPVARNSPFPARILGDMYSNGPLRPAMLELARAEARALAQVLGVVPVVAAVPEEADWVYSDTAHEKFGKKVEAAVMAPAGALVTRAAVGLLEVAGEGWTTVEFVRREDAIVWAEEKSSGPGRDFRVLGLQRDAQKARFRTVRETLGLLTPLTTPPPGDWPYRGPSATLELLTSIRAVSDDVVQFHDHFLRSSGLAVSHPVAVKHRELLSILLHMVCFDQLNVTQSASAECCSRLILQIHQAVKRNPKAPDFAGLQVMTMSKLDSTGGVLTGDFARYVADEQKAEAFTLKQQRLHAEEEDKRRAHTKKDAKGAEKGSHP